MEFLEIKNRLWQLDAACLCDVNKELRVMDPAIRPVNPDIKMCGIARTVQCERDFLSVIKALNDAKENDILVIDGKGGKIALAGELFTAEASRKRLSGIVIDGAFRDTNQVKQLNFPVYARHITPMAGTCRTIFQTQIEVNCGGVCVKPGDIIFGDRDGVVVISEEEISKILDTAESIQQKEELVLEEIKKDNSLLDMLNFSEHFDKISKGEPSTLVFKI
jgi:regulator of RNase E activity RraA